MMLREKIDKMAAIIIDFRILSQPKYWLVERLVNHIEFIPLQKRKNV